MSTTEHLRVVQEISRMVLDLAERLQDNFAGHAAGSGLTAAQAKVLTALQPGGAVSQRDLARRLGHDPSNLTGLVDRLEARGTIRRTPDDRDRRVKMLSLTDAGIDLRRRFLADLTGDPGPLAHLAAGPALALRDGLADALGHPSPERVRDADAG